MDHKQKTDEQLMAMAAHLAARRTAILQTWRRTVDDDPDLSAPSSLPRRQFNDHIPELLDGFERRLLMRPKEIDATDEERNEVAAGHGLQRWQQGYHLRELTREWVHLHLCLVDELASYIAALPDLEPAVILIAWRALAEVFSQSVSESASQYFELRQTEAEGHVRDLEHTLAQVQALERQRGELWQQAAHDLRGNLGVVKNVTSGLTQVVRAPEAARDEFLGMLQNSVSSLYSMLDDVTNLARLQAGHELPDLQPFDAGALLRDLHDNLQPLATERGLYLKAEGPASLVIEGDAVKIRRIAQNLLFNALKYTREGGVTMCWGDSRSNDAERWMLSIEDTGPGFHAGPGAPLAGALKEATHEAHEVEEQAARREAAPEARAPESAAASRPDYRRVHQVEGEGIGLSIVKRLCDMLDASIELESKLGEGTTFRVIFPRHYVAAEHEA